MRFRNLTPYGPARAVALAAGLAVIGLACPRGQRPEAPLASTTTPQPAGIVLEARAPMSVYVECDERMRRYLLVVRLEPCIPGVSPVPVDQPSVRGALVWTAAVVAAAAAASQAGCEESGTCFDHPGETLADVVADALEDRTPGSTERTSAGFCGWTPAERVAVRFFDGTDERFGYTDADGRIAVPARFGNELSADILGTATVPIGPCPYDDDFTSVE